MVFIKNNIPWNKGKHTGLIPKTAFKKGIVPWNKGKEFLQSYMKRNEDFDINLAAEMKIYNPDLFENEIKISDEELEVLFELLEEERDYPPDFLQMASALKVINPEFFDKEIELNDSHWESIAKEIEQHRDSPQYFAYLYDMAHQINPEKIKRKLQITSDYWEKILKGTEVSFLMRNQVIFIKSINRIKPKGFPGLTVSKSSWAILKSSIKQCFIEGFFLIKNFFGVPMN